MKTTKKSFTVREALKHANDRRNQDIKSKFVGQHVFCNINSLAEYVLEKGFEDSSAPFTIDDIENYYSVNTENLIREIASDWDFKEDEFKNYSNRGTFNRRVKKFGDFVVFLNSLDNEELEDFANEFGYEFPESEPAEIFEWWAISSFLYDKLKEKGYCVVDAGSCYIWGRTTTGQAILLDGIISEICADMEILEYQSNSWASKN